MERKGKKISQENLQNNRKLRIFLLFLGLSFFFWLIINLSKEYITELPFEAEYVDLPSNKLFQSEPENQVKLSIKSIGFNILKYKFRTKKVQISLKDVKRSKGNCYIKTADNLNFLQSQFPAETSILKINPDTLKFDFGSRKTKKVPVNHRVGLQFQYGFNVVGQIEVTPGEVSVSGPESVIDTLHFVLTEQRVLENISEDIAEDVKLVADNDRVVFEPGEVQVRAKVDRFTEGTFNLTYKVINVPSNALISTFPKELKLVFQVPLSDFNKVLPGGFEIICDYKETEKNKLDHLTPKIIKQPDFVNSVRVVPNKVEFLIKN